MLGSSLNVKPFKMLCNVDAQNEKAKPTKASY